MKKPSPSHIKRIQLKYRKFSYDAKTKAYWNWQGSYIEQFKFCGRNGIRHYPGQYHPSVGLYDFGCGKFGGACESFGCRKGHGVK